MFGSFNIKKSLPSLCYREFWDYKNTDSLCTQRALSSNNWNVDFGNKMADEKAKSLTNIDAGIDSP